MEEKKCIDITPKQDLGVLKEILREGEGTQTPTPGCKVKVHYEGTLLDGTKFDSSRNRNQPFEFDLGRGSVIKAWDIAVATMKKGELAMLTCAPEYSYGKQGSPPNIPPDSTLKFEVEVLSWKGEDLTSNKDGGIERLQIKPGDGYCTPNDGAIVEVTLIGKYENKEFDKREISFSLGEGSDINIIEGVEKALEKFKRGECSCLIIKPKYAFGTQGSLEFGIPPNATVEYTVTLKSFEKAKESWSLDSEEKIQQGKLFKEKGTNYFKAGKLKLAAKMYKKVLSFLDFEKAGWLTQFFNKVIEEGQTPTDWQQSITVPTFKKKGNPAECSNYGPIRLVCHALKVFERVLDQRIRKIIKLTKNQAGFVKNSSTTDAIHA